MAELGTFDARVNGDNVRFSVRPGKQGPMTTSKSELEYNLRAERATMQNEVMYISKTDTFHLGSLNRSTHKMNQLIINQREIFQQLPPLVVGVRARGRPDIRTTRQCLFLCFMAGELQMQLGRRGS